VIKYKIVYRDKEAKLIAIHEGEASNEGYLLLPVEEKAHAVKIEWKVISNGNDSKY
jgi:hypothetical protein